MASSKPFIVLVASGCIALLSACGGPATGIWVPADVPDTAALDALDVAEPDVPDVPEDATPEVPDTASSDVPDTVAPDVPGPADVPVATDNSSDGGGGAKTCSTDADCEVAGFCPKDALKGCACIEDKKAQKVCKPACAVDADCPTPPDKTLVCSTDGVCIPGAGTAEPAPDVAVPDTPDSVESDVPDAPAPDLPPPSDAGPDGPGGPTSCSLDADCAVAGACPPDATKGCSCVADPQGMKVCRPACGVDGDCPQPPDKTLVCSADGVCVPQ